MSSHDCPVCFEAYDSNSVDLRIRVLKCGHSLCTSCLRTQFSDNFIRCHSCRDERRYRSVDKVPINFLAETLSAEQSTAQRLPQDNTQLAEYLPPMVTTNSPVCFLTLSHRGSVLGNIKLQMTEEYPSRTRHFLDLIRGSQGATWVGAGFDRVWYQGRPGEGICCDYYKKTTTTSSSSSSGSVSPTTTKSYTPLYALEAEGPDTPFQEGELRGYPGQYAGFAIVTRTGGGASTYPVIGHIREGLQVVKGIAGKGNRYAKGVNFTDAGVLTL